MLRKLAAIILGIALATQKTNSSEPPKAPCDLKRLNALMERGLEDIPPFSRGIIMERKWLALLLSCEMISMDEEITKQWDRLQDKAKAAGSDGI